MNIIHQENYTLPVSQKLIDLLYQEMGEIPPMRHKLFGVSFIFRDIHYTPNKGGYHPVEIRLIRQNDQWYFDYITDLSYQGNIYPELEKELDFSWPQRYVFHARLGDLPYQQGCELFELWQTNFLSYWHMGVYISTIVWEN